MSLRNCSFWFHPAETKLVAQNFWIDYNRFNTFQYISPGFLQPFCHFSGGSISISLQYSGDASGATSHGAGESDMEGFSIQKLGLIWFNYPETGNIYTKIHSEFLVERKVEICRMGVLLPRKPKMDTALQSPQLVLVILLWMPLFRNFRS